MLFLFGQSVLDECQGIIESADKFDVLMAVVDLLIYVSDIFPHLFRPHFHVSDVTKFDKRLIKNGM